MSERALRGALVSLAIYPLAGGALALLAPAVFFDAVGRYGAENTHYIADNGSFTLAYGLFLVLALARRTWRTPILLLGAVWYAVHALNHVLDVPEARSSARGIADAALLALGAGAHAALGRVTAR